jgi:hypothetical protein
MKKRIIVGVSVFMILVSGVRVYESKEQMKLKEIRTENHVDKTSNTFDRGDQTGKEVKNDGESNGQVNDVGNMDQPSEHEDIVEKATASGDEQTIEAGESIGPEREEPIVEETIADESASEDVPVELELVKSESVEPELVEAEPMPVPIAESSLSMKSFSEIFIKEKSNIVKTPTTVNEFEAILLHMCMTDTLTYSIVYEGISFDELLTAETQAKIAKAFDSIFNKYPEYMSFTNRMTYKAKGGSDQVTLTFVLSSETGMNEDTLITYRRAFFVESMEIVNELKASGKIYDGQSDRDKALVLFDWVVQNTEYDNNLAAESYTGYGVYANGLGVCQGYTAAYNALSKCAGLSVEGIGGVADGVDHIWTKALFAGADIYIDATWGDSYVNSEKVNYDYFLVDGPTLASSHTW